MKMKLRTMTWNRGEGMKSMEKLRLAAIQQTNRPMTTRDILKYTLDLQARFGPEYKLDPVFTLADAVAYWTLWLKLEEVTP